MPVPEPVAFTIFGLDIMWYAIMICFGIIVAAIICVYRAPKHNLTSDSLLNFMIICLPAAVIGARAYYVFFNWAAYSGDFFRIINFRAGGLAIHGGLIFGIGTALLLCLIWKVRPLELLDLIAPSIAIGQAIGRWGNYFNSEAHGGPTDLPWAVTINGQGYHPTFLYESIWCFILFFILIAIDRRRKFEGQIFLLYGILYSVERFFVEGLRTDSLMLGSFKQAQVISLVIIAVFLVMYVMLGRRKNSKVRR